MNKNLTLLLLSGLFAHSVCHASHVIDGDLTIEKGACIGFDCNAGENLAPGDLKLKENNTRIRLHNTSIAPDHGVDSIFGESWNVEANDNVRGQSSYFDFQVKSTRRDNLLSDGTAKAYNCDDIAVTHYEPQNLPSVGLVPVGEPFFVTQIIPSSCKFDGGFACLHECVANTELNFSKARVLNFAAEGGGVSIGYNRDFGAELEQTEVALGHKDLKRQLVNLGDALNTSDLVNLRGLKFQRVEAMLAQLTTLNNTLDELENSIDEYEDSITTHTNLGGEGKTTTLDLSKRNILNIDTSQQSGPYGPSKVHIAFFPSGGQPLDGLTFRTEQGDDHQLTGWWQQFTIAIKPEQVSVMLLGLPDSTVNVQWWYGW